MKTVVLVGALDTKGAEFKFVKEDLLRRDVNVLVVDFGVLGEPAFAPDVRPRGGNSGRWRRPSTLPRRRAERPGDEDDGSWLGHRAARRLFDEGRLDGILGMGGTGGTSIATTAMRSLPVGVPKLMVSTVGGGDVSAYAGTKDIIFQPSIVDVAGFNPISRRIYVNAAGAIAGMVSGEAPSQGLDKPLIGASMFGNTTPAVDRARERLESRGYEVLAFHATGSGGKTMEDLVGDGYFQGVLDLTTTELADYVCGGVMSAGPLRGRAAPSAGVPVVLVPGCVDMANFDSPDTVPAKYRQRVLYEWNPNVTLLRTNEEENVRIGNMLADAANAGSRNVAVLLPSQRSVSIGQTRGEVLGTGCRRCLLRRDQVPSGPAGRDQ